MHKTDVLRVVWSVDDNYIYKLSSNPNIITVVLPWQSSRSNWSSLTDCSNVLYQRYFVWTADNVLCTWIETPGVIKARYDVVYGKTCNRNINDTTTMRSLRMLTLNARPVNPSHYWPNNGSSYPKYFYTTTPAYVFHMHIHRDALITELGDVITAGCKLILYACSHDISPSIPIRFNMMQINLHSELFVINQHWGTGTFHCMAEIVPRLALHLHF